jgi:hypothetical protein
MPGTRFKEDLLDLDKGEIRRSWPGRTMAGKSAGAIVIELGITLAGAESERLENLLVPAQKTAAAQQERME